MQLHDIDQLSENPDESSPEKEIWTPSSIANVMHPLSDRAAAELTRRAISAGEYRIRLLLRSEDPCLQGIVDADMIGDSNGLTHLSMRIQAGTDRSSLRHRLVIFCHVAEASHLLYWLLMRTGRDLPQKYAPDWSKSFDLSHFNPRLCLIEKVKADSTGRVLMTLAAESLMGLTKIPNLQPAAGGDSE